MKVFVVGGGGREHAILRKLKENPAITGLYCAPGNGGIAYDAQPVPIAATDVDALAQYNEGPYAYWLAAGFPVDADEEMIRNVITLFCDENLAELQADDAA